MSSFGAVTAAVTLLPMFRTPKWRPFRAGMFVALGLSGFIPVLHGLSIYGLAGLDKQLGLRWVMAEAFMYILGAGIYAARVPEKWAPGRFDLVGSSHQIFHLFVVAAAGMHLTGMVAAFDNLHGHMGASC